MVVLFDDMISEMESLELHRQIKQWHPDVVGVLVTAAETAHSANGDDVFRILSKPVDFDELVSLIEEIDDEPSSSKVAPAGESHANPGLQGEHALQQQYGTKKRAEIFYDRQLLAVAIFLDLRPVSVFQDPFPFTFRFSAATNEKL